MASSDYKIIKCYEAALSGYAMPYEIKALHNERQLLRDKINELEARYTSLSDDIFNYNHKCSTNTFMIIFAVK